MGGLNHRSFDLVWSDECLGGRGKDCTSQSLNCKLLFVQITAHSRLHTKSLKSTELGGPRGTRRSFLGTLHARRVLQNENSACCFREHSEGSVLGKNGAWGVCIGTQTKKPEGRAKKFRSLDARRSFAKRNQPRRTLFSPQPCGTNSGRLRMG